MLSLDKGKSHLKFFFALFALIFVLLISSPVVASANEVISASKRVHIIDKDNYYTDEEKQEIAKEIGNSEQVHNVIKFIAPLDNEDAKSLSFKELLDSEYPDLSLDGFNVAIYAPWLEGEYAGMDCEAKRTGEPEHSCFYLENVDNTKERDGSVDNMIALVKEMQEEQIKNQRDTRNILGMVTVIFAFLTMGTGLSLLK